MTHTRFGRRAALGLLLVLLGLLAAPPPAGAGGLTLLETHTHVPAASDGLGSPVGVAVSPDGAHVYVASEAQGAIAVFARDGGTGALTPVAVVAAPLGSPLALQGVTALVLSPDGAYIYAAASVGDAVSVFARDGGTGMLTFVEEEVDDTGGVDGLNHPVGLALSPGGEHLYVAGERDDAIAIFDRDAGTGALTFAGIVQEGVLGISGLRLPQRVIVSPDGADVYVSGKERTQGAVVGFRRDAGTGLLTPNDLEEEGFFGVHGIGRSAGLAMSADGTSLYVTGRLSKAVAVFSRDAGSGLLTFVDAVTQGSEIDGLDAAEVVAVTPDGGTVYAAGRRAAGIAHFTRDAASGRLTYVELAADGVPEAKELAAGLTVSPDGANAYATDGAVNLLVFGIDACGSGVVGPDEQCDDGGVVGGDGCSATCRLELCPPTPVAGCRTAESGKAQLQLQQKVVDGKDKLKWKWKKGAATAAAEFGDPRATTSYLLCVYDASASAQPLVAVAAPAGQDCAGKPCWKALGDEAAPKGYKYTDKLLTPDGVKKVKVKEGLVDGKAQAQVLGKGAKLHLPPLPLALPARAQLVNDETGVCWEATFNTVVRNDAEQFKAKSD
jgi:cysteine-rich repeat protein